MVWFTHKDTQRHAKTHSSMIGQRGVAALPGEMLEPSEQNPVHFHNITHTHTHTPRTLTHRLDGGHVTLTYTHTHTQIR